MLSIQNVTYTKCYLDEKLLYENVLYEMLLYENVLYEMLLIRLTYPHPPKKLLYNFKTYP